MVLAQNDALHETEGPLRKIITDLQLGEPDAGGMEPELDAAVRAQAAAIGASLKSLGTLQQVEFESAERGTDIYKVTFENGATNWMIRMSPAGKIAGLFFKPVPVAEANGEDVAVAGLSGTLLKPKFSKAEGNEHPPVMLLIGGSGPTDRNGNPGGTGPGELRQLAEQLAEIGIASLRYDKRGVGRSPAPGLREEDLVLNAYVDDAVAWLDWLQQRSDLGKRIVAGHSEGGLIAMLAAKRSPVASIILLATPGRKVADVMRDQLQRIGMDPPLQAAALTVLASLERGEKVPSVNPALQALFRPSVQPYLISELSIDPAKELKNLALPVMIVSGGHDLQVSSADAALLSAERPDATRLDVPGMNHVLKMAPADRAGQQDAYSNPNLALAEGLVDAIANFVRQSAR
jgi:pimeloyl-ACP methyl ester carboxylesterase